VKRAAALVTMAVALVMGGASASATPMQAVGPVPQRATSAATTAAPTVTTAPAAPTQLAPVSTPASHDKTSVRNSGRRLLVIAGALAVLALLMIGFTVWFWRSTVPTPEVLRPLEKLRPGDGKTEKPAGTDR
jgi:hypothetical protein